MSRKLGALLVITFLAWGCSSPRVTHTPVVPSYTATNVPTITASPVPSATPTVTPTTTPLPPPPSVTPLPTSPPTVTYVGPGCQRPPDDYRRVEIRGETLNARTVWMLQQAVALYEGPGDLLRVTQGSYTTGVADSFGTHAGGGAVDISIRNTNNPSEVLWDETGAMVLALRQAGFAAWYRAPGALGPVSPAHIHAIAIGDRELSPAARQQVNGPYGYLQGFDGLPPEYGGPHPDPHGGPILCPWMLDLDR